MMMETGNKLSLSRIIVSGSGMILASQTELYHAIIRAISREKRYIAESCFSAHRVEAF